MVDIPPFLKRKGSGVTHSFANKPANYMPSDEMVPRPPEKVWAEAKLYRCDLYDTRWPVCGTRLIWVVVGRKWVKLCTPIQHDKWRIKRTDWDNIRKEFIR